MIIRARPKYLLEEDFIAIDKTGKESISQQECYFNRGSSALKFVLENLVSFLEKDITVCMQSLNCQTVLEAALEVPGVNVFLSDIKTNDFSISLSFLEDNYDKIDILFLLHYQGLINTEYDEIIEFCKENKIIVIEDLAHVLEGSHTLKGDFGIYSYAFDKPLTSFSGGKVEINFKSNEFINSFLDNYNSIQFENKSSVEKDIKLLKYFMRISKEGEFKSNLDNRAFVNILIGRFSKESITKLLNNNLLYFIFRVLFKFKSKISKPKSINEYEVLRLDYKKISLIKMQYERSLHTRSDLLKLQNEIINKLIKSNVVSEINTKCFWNRISFIPKNNKLLSKEVQHGNFNWPTPLHVMYSELPNVKTLESYPNTSFVSKNIVNFPCWSEKALDYLS